MQRLRRKLPYREGTKKVKFNTFAKWYKMAYKNKILLVLYSTFKKTLKKRREKDIKFAKQEKQ